MDVDEFIKSRFPQYYKAKSTRFGMSLKPEGRTNRGKEQNLQRKKLRSETLLQRRNIQEIPISQNEDEQKQIRKYSRKSLLKIWQQQKKLKLAEEKAQRKTAFKIPSAPNVGFPAVNKIPTNYKSIAPKDFQFKPPKNVKPLLLTKISNKPAENSQCNDINKVKATGAIKRVTRSQKPQASPPIMLPNRKTRKASVLTESGNNARKTTVASIIPLKQTQKKTLVRQLAVCSESTENITKLAVTSTESSDKSTVKPKTKVHIKRKSMNRKRISKAKLNGSYEMEESKTENIESDIENKISDKVLETNSSNNDESKTKTPMRRKSGRRSTNRRRSLNKKVSTEDKLNETLTLHLSDSNNAGPSNTMSKCEIFHTPGNQINTPNNRHSTVYISPFVSTSRGKGSVKKENREREARGLPSFTEHTTPDEIVNKRVQSVGAGYFHTQLDNEIARLLSLCGTWDAYKDGTELPEEALDLIDVATGQAKLLINKKFQQFRGLINSCQSGEGDKLITCEDLQGFWDMVYIQVENLNLRFERLTEMKNNNWEEIMPEVKKKITKKCAPVKRTKGIASSNLRAAIQAARKTTMQTRSQTNETKDYKTESVFDGGFFVVKSPSKSKSKTPNITPGKTRLSLRASVLTSEARKKLSTPSLGITIMKVSQSAKELDRISTGLESLVPTQTPEKSILKSAQKKKRTRASKVVLFKDDSQRLEE